MKARIAFVSGSAEIFSIFFTYVSSGDVLFGLYSKVRAMIMCLEVNFVK
jgi:hypothetical protein